MTLRAVIFKRDKGVCAACKTDVAEIEKQIIDNPELQSLLLQVGFPEHAIKRAVEEGRTLWNVDHITPKYAGGTDSPENLRTLCVRCHSFLTREQARYRALGLHNPEGLFGDDLLDHLQTLLIDKEQVLVEGFESLFPGHSWVLLNKSLRKQ